jgi:outer membrane immunogenic protein
MTRQLLAGVAITALLTGAALGADLPVKVPLKAPVACPSCNWNGYYVGINFGGSIGHDTSQDAISLNPAGLPNGLGGLPPGVFNPISNTTYNSSPAGFVGGGQAGFNWQVGHWVLGAEGDWDFARQRDNLQINNFIASSTTVATNTSYGYSDEEKIKWLATARGRVGWASGYTLAYVTGGAAWGGVDSNYAFAGFGSNLFATAPAAASFSTTKTGWVLGSGVETSLGWMGANHWSAKLEYLYVDLGTVSNSFAVPLPASPAPGGPSSYTATSSTHIRDNIVRVGLNYRFGGDQFAPPPTPGPCPTCNWTGFYVGVNEATSIGHDRAHETVSLLPPTANAANITNPLTDVWHTESPIGWGAGGQLGFNWQTGNIVFGAEGDLDWMSQRDSFSNANFVASTVNVAPAMIGLTDDQKLEWLATARGRIGWTENCFLWYVTGGVAWGRVESNYAFQVNQIAGGVVTFPAGPFAASASTTKTGWTIGGGVESTLSWLGLGDRWSSKFEYLYVDLGSISNSFSIPLTTGAGAYTLSSSSEIRDHIIRFGVNYRFGG